MYYSHFGLNQAPFKITPNTEFFFSGGNRGPILEALIYAITHGEGIIKVTGEVGSGKTMLCHMLPTRLPPHIDIVYIANPSVSSEEILHAIAFDLQLPVERGAQRLEVMQALHDFLVKRHAEGKRVVVFVEESQSMPLATLEEIRLLSNLETKNDKLLQIVLFGQPELDDNLRQPNIRQLRERITHSFRLEPFKPGEVREYLMFRMRAAGYRGPDLFSSSVVKRIARDSLGLTRRVNLIADKALLAAFSENTHTIRPKHIEAAVRDSEFSQHLPDRAEPARVWGSAVLVAAGAALGVGIYALLQQAGPQPAATAMATPAPPRAEATSEPAPPSPLAPAAERAAPSETKVAARATPAAQPERPVPGAATTTAAPAGDTKPAGGRDGAPTAADPDLLEARLAATEQWLASEALGTFSIQLLGTNDAEQLKEHLNALSKFVEINKVFVYRTKAKQKPSITVLYGSFTSPREAREALDKLPQSLRANQPILRTVQGIRAEIKQHQTTS
jgi:type II secretory pathway predicted ATPase ExeA/septal ring-binding cell division protein DamX